jgi:hypothetical protein
MNNCRRTIFLVDRQVQGSLIARTIAYWFFFQFSVVLMLICWECYAAPARGFITLATDLVHRYGPALLASFILLPIVMMDVVRLSNRFVGPVVRLKGALRALAAGENVRPLLFRDNDYWREMAGDLNEVARQLNDAKQPPSVPESLPADQSLADV